MSYVGQSVQKYDSVSKVKGEAAYPGDINMPGQAFMKILFSDRPHAIVKQIDSRAAESMVGVLAVFTAKDVPVNEYGQIIIDQPVLCGPGSTKPFADRVRFVGDQIAVVVAETEEIAAQAVKRIVVTYEDLPVIGTIEEGLREGAVLLHPDKGTNILNHIQIRHGNVEEAFKKADVIIEGVYDTPAQEHAYLQPEAGLSYIDEEGRVTVIVAGQWTHEEQEEIAHALDLPLDKVRVIYPAIGGAFGGREDMSVQIVLALATWRLHQRGINRPIKIIWNREESIVGHAKRHPYHIKAKWGATRDGKVIAADMQLYGDAGAYAYTSTTVLGNAVVMCTAPYEVPNANVDGYSVYTNNLPSAAFRGFGGPQGAFAAEQQMSKLAAALGMDPVEIRARNVVKEGSVLTVGTELPKGVSMPEVLEACALQAGWIKTQSGWKRSAIENKLSEPHKKRGLGLACSFKNIGFSFGFQEECWATIELYGGAEVEKVIFYHAGADVGQGGHTVLKQMAATALGLPIDIIETHYSDTATSHNSGSASASRLTLMAGNSIIGAAKLALEKWENEERPAKATYQYLAQKTTPFEPGTGKSFPNITYGYVAEAVDLEIDTETGQIKLINVVCADDVGKAINPELVRGQIEGCVVQAAGYSVLEDFIQKDGQVLTKTLSTYLIPTILDIPDKVDSLILEYPDPAGPWGARGMAEMPFLPLAPAVTAAIYDAVGVWVDRFPVTPERLLTAMGKL
jgi:CO/xanthine dehydrogenase Mo-binding subunit